jgi:hypothetical protein
MASCHFRFWPRSQPRDVDAKAVIPGNIVF